MFSGYSRDGMLLVAVALLAATSAFAQTNAETNAGIQFNFSLPGAKNLAMGGAFLALADDATAAYANPAGLTILSRPEISMEARSWTYTHVYTDRGRLVGEPTGMGVDTIAGLQHGKTQDRVTDLSFFSFVYAQRKTWAVAFYRHELANFEANFETQGAFHGTQDERLWPARTVMDLDIVNHGISASFSDKKGRIRIGIGLSYYDFSINSRTIRFFVPLADRFAPPDYSAGNEINSQIQFGNDSDQGVNLGLIWEITENFRLGGSYRQGPEFVFRAVFQPAVRALPTFVSSEQRAHFRVPDAYGLGIAYQPTDAITITLDYNRIRYSQMTKGLTNIYGINLPEPETDHFRSDDAGEIHIGFEYAFLQAKVPLFLRLGSWYDPDHRIRFEGDIAEFRALFQPGTDEIHYTAGLGIIAKSFEVHAGFDYSELVKTASVSAVVRF